MGVYVVRTSTLNDKHSCQLFRKASSLVLLSSSVSTANLSCLLATTFSSLRSTSPLQSFESGQALFLVIVCVWRPFLSLSFLLLALSFSRLILSLSFLCSSVSEVLLALSFSFLSERFFFSFFFVHAKALAYRK